MQIRALMWVLNCMVQRTPIEELRVAALTSKSLGTSIPIVALFNPNSAGAVCARDPAGFLANAHEHGVNVREVLHVDTLDVAAFEARYPVGYPVYIPPTLAASLDRIDPDRLAADLDKVVEQVAQARKLRCDALPTHLATVRASLAKVNAADVSEAIPLCVEDKCDHIPTPPARSCSIKYCARQQESCRSCGGFIGGITGKKCCSTYCAEESVRDDSACITANAATIKQTQDQVEACIRRARDAQAACEASRSVQADEAKATNKANSERRTLLLADEASTTAAMVNCDKVLGK